MEVTSVPRSFDLKTKNMFFTHFYFKKYKIKLGSGKEFQSSRVLYIDLSKRLNDYYASMI
jgi:hypothetical protein